MASTKSISRSRGQSAVASACYRAGDKIYDERYGKTHDYSKRSGVMSADIILPKHLKDTEVDVDRATLWNLAEQSENRKNSRVAREWLINLPHELSEAARHELALEFAQALADKFGVIADVAIHKPTAREIAKGADPRNYHAHIMLTTRQAEIGNDGNLVFGKKVDCELSDTDRKKLGLCKAKDEVTELRQLYEELVNTKLIENGLAHKQVNCRSYKDQGLDIIPQVKVGAKSTQLERRGKTTLEGDTNRLISERNKRVRKKTLALLRRKKRTQQPLRNANIKMRYQRQRQEKIDYDATRERIERADREIAQFNEFFKITTDAAKREQRQIAATNQELERSKQRIDDLTEQQKLAQSAVSEQSRIIGNYQSEVEQFIKDQLERKRQADRAIAATHQEFERREQTTEQLCERLADKQRQLAERLLNRRFCLTNPISAQKKSLLPIRFSLRQITILDDLAEFLNENSVLAESQDEKIIRLAQKIDDTLLAQHPDALNILLNCQNDELQYQNAQPHWQNFIAKLDAARERTLKNNAHKFLKNPMLNQLTISESTLNHLVDYSQHPDTPKLSQAYANQRLQQELATTCQNYHELCQQHDLRQKLTEPHLMFLKAFPENLMNKFGEYLNPEQTVMLAAAHKTLEINAQSPKPPTISDSPDFGF